MCVYMCVHVGGAYVRTCMCVYVCVCVRVHMCMHVCVYMYMCVYVRSENSVEPVLCDHLYMGSRSPSGLHGGHLYPLSHLTDTFLQIIHICIYVQTTY